jgi:3-oxoacyl-[acyl-carrier protein] reductase
MAKVTDDVVSGAEDRMNKHRKRVLVTGASGGIGRAICLDFAGAGWTVGVHYCNSPEAAAGTAALISNRVHGQEPEGKPNIYRADITLQSEVQHLVQNFIRDHGGLETIVCNAGIAAASLLIRQSTEEWERVIGTDLTGVFHCVQAAGRAMIESGGGSIIVVGSYAGTQGAPGQAAYASAKAGLIGLVKTAASEYGPSNIRVNLVYPGRHPTALAGSAFPDEISTAGHVLGRRSNLEEIARTICHLAELSGVSGQIWNLDSRIP